MLDRDNPVQGVGTYVEFSGDYGSLQYAFTPHGYSEDGALLMPYVLHRFLSVAGQRARWKRVMVPVEPSRDDTPDDYMAKALDRNGALLTLVKRVSYGNWTPSGPPLYFEVSKKDLTSLRAGKSPSAMMQRIEKLRTVAEFNKVKEED